MLTEPLEEGGELQLLVSEVISCVMHLKTGGKKKQPSMKQLLKAKLSFFLCKGINCFCSFMSVWFFVCLLLFF